MRRIAGCKSAGRMWWHGRYICGTWHRIKKYQRGKDLMRLGYIRGAQSSHIIAFWKVEKGEAVVLWFNDVPILDEPISFLKWRKWGKCYAGEITIEELKVIYEFYKREGDIK